MLITPCLLWRSRAAPNLIPEAKFGYRNEFSRLLTGENETQAVHGSTGRVCRISTASQSSVRTKLVLTVYRRIIGQPHLTELRKVCPSLAQNRCQTSME